MDLRWVRTHEDRPDMAQYSLDGTDLDMYIQPGGCLELGQTDIHGNREFVHFCPDQFDAVLTAVEMAKGHGNKQEQ